jgi:hypothetical protein
MTTVNLEEIENAIKAIEEKEQHIDALEGALIDANEQYEDMLNDLYQDPKYEKFCELSDRLKILRERGVVQADATFPVDEPLEKLEPVENWEAKDVPPTDEDFAAAFSNPTDRVADESGHTPTAHDSDATPELSNELESATGGDEAADSGNTTTGLKLV